MGESEERGGSQGGVNVGESDERGGQKPMSTSKFLCTGGWVHAALPLSADGTPSLARCRDMLLEFQYFKPRVGIQKTSHSNSKT